MLHQHRLCCTCAVAFTLHHSSFNAEQKDMKPWERTLHWPPPPLLLLRPHATSHYALHCAVSVGVGVVSSRKCDSCNHMNNEYKKKKYHNVVDEKKEECKDDEWRRRKITPTQAQVGSVRGQVVLCPGAHNIWHNNKGTTKTKKKTKRLIVITKRKSNINIICAQQTTMQSECV